MQLREHGFGIPGLELPPGILRDFESRVPAPLIGWRAPPPILDRPSIELAPPTYQAIGTVSEGSGNQSPAWPAHAVDDIAILLVMQKIGDVTAPVVPTLSPANSFARGALPTETRADGSQSLRVTAWYCRATSTSMSAPTVLIGDAAYQSTVIITFRGCTTSGDPTDVSSTANNTGTSVSIGAATTTGPAIVCAFAAAYDDGFDFTSWTNAALTSFTERLDNGAVATGSISAATGSIASAASYGTATATISSSVWAGFQFALKPPVSASTSGNLLLLGVG